VVWEGRCREAPAYPDFNAFLARHPLPAGRIIHRYTSWNESLA
jgi:hypothetical protein